ncbi:GIY-YIG nuclease family protein [Thalassoglobus sp. JC818]|uniref:GIY-YIG nuclease family protein n=1 Tax=Thalassoglobus sp. JC818 TaxID=3232136 RepID=UPI00345A553B
MHSISKSPGVYVLVFYLSRKTAITFDRKGAQHKFLPGWYLYVGSACGPGGLDRRLTRPKRQRNDGKRMHWNVDYFRERALLCEIWYSANADSNVEHQWAKALMELPSATAPVAKFGASDCRAKCPSHFFHAPDRPSTAVFRKTLASRSCSTEVFVEFIKEPRRTKKVECGLQREYFDGRRFLELRRRVATESKSPLCEWSSLAKHCPARQLAEQIATQTKTSFPKLKRAIQFATAVDSLIEHCGESVLPVLFDPVRPQSRVAVLRLSRTSDVRQRHRINGVSRGGSDPLPHNPTIRFSIR